jgi:hypothetical protein
MKLKGEGRTFSKDEAESVHMLVDLIARYAVESTVWWEEGLGDKVDQNGNPAPGQKKEGDDNKTRRLLRHSPLPIADGDRQRPSDNPAGAWLVKALQTRIAELGAMESGRNRSSQ